MKRPFELDNLYSLFQAFDLLGKKLFSNEWKGTEPWALPIDSPKSLIARRDVIQFEIDENELETMKISQKLRVIAQGPKRDEMENKITLYRERNRSLYEQKGNLADYNDAYIADFELSTRRKTTEQNLIDALLNDSIVAQFGDSWVINWKKWSSDRGFQCIIPLSMVRVNSRRSRSRRGAVFLSKVDFDQWLLKVTPIVGEKKVRLTPQQSCEMFISKCVANGSRKKKNECFEEAKKNILNLSRNAFDKAWKKAAPDHWKKRGRFQTLSLKNL